MKKMIFIVLSAFIAFSCSTVSYTYGDITLMNDDGEVIRNWNHSTIETSVSGMNGTITSGGLLKNGGVNFFDSNNKHLYISGGIIIIDNVSTSHQNYTKDEENYCNQVNYLNEQYEMLTAKYNTLLKEIKKMDKSDPEYQEKMKELYNITKMTMEIAKEYIAL